MSKEYFEYSIAITTNAIWSSCNSKNKQLDFSYFQQLYLLKHFLLTYEKILPEFHLYLYYNLRLTVYFLTEIHGYNHRRNL